MDTRRIGLVLLVLMLPMPAHADRHKIGGRSGIARADRSSLWGVQYSIDSPVKGWPKGVWDEPKDHTLGLVGEVSIVDGTHQGEAFSQETRLGGLRYSYNRVCVCRKRFEVSAQALIGKAKETQGGIRRNLGAYAFGAGLYVPTRDPTIGIGVQYDFYGVRAHPTAWYGQFSVGVVFRIERTNQHKPRPCGSGSTNLD